MFHRKLFLAACLYAAVSLPAFGQGAGYLFQLTENAAGNFYPYIETANPLNPVVANAIGPAGVSQVIVKPDGSKFYLLSSSGTGAIQSVDATFTKFNTVNLAGASVNTPVTTAVVTPDGKHLLVGADMLYVVDTTTDQVVSKISVPTVPIVSIAVSRDSKFAYVLRANSFHDNSVTSYDLTALTQVNNLDLPYSGGTSIGMSPLGMLYVSATNRIYEVNPTNLTLVNAISVTAQPGPAQFTPDGTTALFVNATPNIGGASLVELALASNAITTWPQSTISSAPVFTNVFIKDSGHAIAFSPATNTLWDVTINPLNAVQSTINSIFQNQTLLSVATSTEVTAAQYLFVLAANGPQITLNRIALSNNTLNIQSNAQSTSGVLQFVTVPSQANPGTFIQFNNPQTGLAPGATTAPLIARVLTASGVPVFNLPVTFTTDAATTAAGLVINTPSPVTTADGYVQTTVTMPQAPGTYTVTLTAGVAATTFTLTIPGATTCTSNCGTTGSGGSSQITVISGNGQLLEEGQVSSLPMTVLVTDTNGNPVASVPVTFTPQSGTGFANPQSTSTDVNGLASSYFLAQFLQQGLGFQTTLINVSAQTAATNYGSVNLSEVTFHLDPTVGTTGTGLPAFNVLTPGPGVTINISRGTPLPNAIQIQTLSQDSEATGVPIPGVGIQTQNAYNPSLPAPASCGAGSTLSDTVTGTASCTLVVSCTASLGVTPLTVIIGGGTQIPVNGVTLNITGGGASSLKVANANLSGNVGQTISLSAQILDGCGSPSAGVPVTWKIVQGSATFASTVSTSNAAGNVSAQVTLGQVSGLVQVSVTAAGVTPGTFSITNNQTIAGISLTSGGGQSATVTQAFSQPLTFTVTDNNSPAKPVAGATVAFSVTTGAGILNPFSGTTNAQGQVTTSLTAGSTAGQIVVTASVAGFSASASLTAVAASLPVTPSSFTNAASGAVGLVPCGLGTLIANGIAPNVSGSISGTNGFGPLNYTLGGFSMTIDGVDVPLLSISNQNGVQQVNFQTPCESPVGSPATAVITVNGGTTTVQGIQMLQAQPGIFTYAGPNNMPYGWVISAVDGSTITPSNPAHIGQNYYLVATGLGEVSPATKTNSTGIGGQTVPLQVVVGVSNAGVPVVSAQYAFGQIGVYVVEFTIPPGSPIGPNQPLALEVVVNGTPVFGNPVYLPAVSN